MVADGYDDCEGDILARVRALVGPTVPVGAELDPHSHVTPLMVESATALVCYKEFPHTDYAERATDLFRLVADAAAGRTRPHSTLWDCRMIGSYFTTIQPMKGFVDHVKGLEHRDGVLSISPVHGFPYGDVPGNGTKMLVITDDRPDRGAALARDLGIRWIALRGRTHPEMLAVAEAVERSRRVAGRPVVLADVADNPGGGFAGDSTVVLRSLLDLGVTDAAFATIWDPVAVSFARAAGPGARLAMRIGGKSGVLAGAPLDLDVEVTAVTDDLYQRYAGVGSSLGPAAALKTPGGLTIIVASRRHQVRSPDVFRGLGIDPMTTKLLAVKSTNHFRAEFEKIAAEILYVAPPDVFSGVPFRRIPRPKWPLDPDAFSDLGIPA
jgi:microcystin degradation protein MlrC